MKNEEEVVCGILVVSTFIVFFAVIITVVLYLIFGW